MFIKILPKPTLLLQFQRVGAKLKKNWKLSIGIFVISLFTLTALLTPVFVDYSEKVISFHPSEKYQNPNKKYWFGTDGYGRDIFWRVVWGTKLALYVGVFSVILGLLIGVPLGMFCGFWGDWRDGILMRINDAFLSFPSLMLCLLVVATLGSSINNAVIAIGITFFPKIARVMRSCTISVKNEQFVIAAKSRGESDFYIIFKEILPNVLGPMIVEGGVRTSYAIVIGASLSYLGLGAQPPQPEWGLMIFEARQQVFLAPWTLIFPSIALVILILGFNIMGDGLRDVLDPKERSSKFF